MNTLKSTESVRATVSKDYAKTELSKSLDIDFSYNDDKSMRESNQESSITREKLIAALKQITSKKTACFQEFNQLKLDSMIDYIINTHHQYAKENAIIIYELAQKVAYHHSKNYPELTKLTTEMFFFLHDLLNCMMKEEEILFPNIRQLIKSKSYSAEFRDATFGLIKEWVSLVRTEHQASVTALKLFHELTNDYTLPEDACSSYKCLFEKMKEFEDDLLMHVDIENNILFPKALDEDKGLYENTFVDVNP